MLKLIDFRRLILCLIFILQGHNYVPSPLIFFLVKEKWVWEKTREVQGKISSSCHCDVSAGSSAISTQNIVFCRMFWVEAYLITLFWQEGNETVLNWSWCCFFDSLFLELEQKLFVENSIAQFTNEKKVEPHVKKHPANCSSSPVFDCRTEPVLYLFCFSSCASCQI